MLINNTTGANPSSRRWLLATALAFLALAPLRVNAQDSDERPLVVESLQCRGAETTSCDYILSHVRVRAGDPVDEEELRNATFRLSALPSFTSVRIFLERGSERGKVNVIVEVAEASPMLAEGLFRVANNGANVLGARVAHQNLRGAGERLDFSAIVRSPVEGPFEHETEYALLQYVDPSLFATERYFFIAGLSDNDTSLLTRYGDEIRIETTGVSLSAGRRIGAFSYLALRYDHLPTGTFHSEIVRTDGSIEINDVSFSRVFAVDYGWNSEDDPYFPTQGGRFNASLGLTAIDSRSSTDPEIDGDTDTGVGLTVSYRHTWRFAEKGFSTLALGSPGTETRSALDEGFVLSYGYARELAPDGPFARVRRGRWYLEAGWNWLGLGDGREVQEAGLEGGLRLSTKSFGMVELALRATTETEW